MTTDPNLSSHNSPGSQAQSPAENPTQGKEDRLGSGQMFDGIAQRYDMLNRVMSLGLDRAWRKATVAALALPPGGGRVLDLATGTADIALAVAKRYPEAEVVGTDPSERMIEIGREKIAQARLDKRIQLELGDAQAIAHPDASFDGVTIAFGIRNVPDRKKALAEMARVTRPGGRIAILELSEPRRGLMAPMARFHIRVLVPRLGALLSGSREYRYLQSSIEAFPPAEEFAVLMDSAGIQVLSVTPFTFGVCHLYVGTPKATGTDTDTVASPDPQGGAA